MIRKLAAISLCMITVPVYTMQNHGKPMFACKKQHREYLAAMKQLMALQRQDKLHMREMYELKKNQEIAKDRLYLLCQCLANLKTVEPQQVTTQVQQLTERAELIRQRIDLYNAQLSKKRENQAQLHGAIENYDLFLLIPPFSQEYPAADSMSGCYQSLLKDQRFLPWQKQSGIATPHHAWQGGV